MKDEFTTVERSTANHKAWVIRHRCPLKSGTLDFFLGEDGDFNILIRHAKEFPTKKAATAALLERILAVGPP